jgi:predicted nucleic acid-binding protein
LLRSWVVARHLLTEDLNHGQDYDGVVVVNPFRDS